MTVEGVSFCTTSSQESSTGAVGVAGAGVAAVVAAATVAALVLAAVVELVVLVLFDEPPPQAENTIIEINTTQPINRVFTPRLPFLDAPTGYPTRLAEPPGRTSSTRR